MNQSSQSTTNLQPLYHFICAASGQFCDRAVTREADESVLKTLLDTLLKMKVLTS